MFIIQPFVNFYVQKEPMLFTKSLKEEYVLQKG